MTNNDECIPWMVTCWIMSLVLATVIAWIAGSSVGEHIVTNDFCKTYTQDIRCQK